MAFLKNEISATEINWRAEEVAVKSRQWFPPIVLLVVMTRCRRTETVKEGRKSWEIERETEVEGKVSRLTEVRVRKWVGSSWSSLVVLRFSRVRGLPSSYARFYSAIKNPWTKIILSYLSWFPLFSSTIIQFLFQHFFFFFSFRFRIFSFIFFSADFIWRFWKNCT